MASLLNERAVDVYVCIYEPPISKDEDYNPGLTGQGNINDRNARSLTRFRLYSRFSCDVMECCHYYCLTSLHTPQIDGVSNINSEHKVPEI